MNFYSKKLKIRILIFIKNFHKLLLADYINKHISFFYIPIQNHLKIFIIIIYIAIQIIFINKY